MFFTAYIKLKQSDVIKNNSKWSIHKPPVLMRIGKGIRLVIKQVIHSRPTEAMSLIPMESVTVSRLKQAET